MFRFRQQANTRLHKLIVAVLTLAALSASCADESRPLPTAEQRPRAVRVAEARILTLLTGVDYVGTLRSAREVEVVARTAGTIVALPVDEGFRVTTGEIVAQLDDAEIRSLRRQVRSDRRRVRTDRDYVCDSAATDERLARQGAISTAQVDRSRATCQSAEAVVETVQARLDEVESVLERTDELSPFDGIVLRRVAEVGQNVVPGRPLMILGDTNLEVVVPVTEGDLRRGVAVGTPARLTLGTGAVLEATVSEVAPLFVGPGRTADVRVDAPDDSVAGLRHGESVAVSFTLGTTAEASAVPIIALARRADEWGVFVVDAEENARWRAVTPGVREDGWVAVEPRLDEATRVAVTNLDVLSDGDPVYAVVSQP